MRIRRHPSYYLIDLIIVGISYKVDKVESLDDELVEQLGVSADFVRVPAHVDLSLAHGTPISTHDISNSTMAGGGQLRRFRTLPSIGPGIATSNTGAAKKEAEDSWFARPFHWLGKYHSLWPVIESEIFNYLLQFVPSFSFGGPSASLACMNMDTWLSGHGPVKLIKWHPTRQLVAVVHQQDAIYFYDAHMSQWLPFYIYDVTRMQKIRCLEWAPRVSNMLAIGCETGVCLWKLNALTGLGTHQHHHQHVGKKSFLSLGGTTNQLIHLTHEDCRNVSSVAFSPTADHLYTASLENGHVGVWSTDSEEFQLISLNKNLATTEMKVSPDGLYIALSQYPPSSTTSHEHTRGKLRILETFSWTDTTISYPQSRIRNLNWTPDSRALLFTLENRSEIHSVILTKAFPSLAHEFDRAHRIEERTYPMESIEDGTVEELVCGGTIDQMILSPSGTRLIVSFTKSQKQHLTGKNYLLVMNVSPLGLGSSHGGGIQLSIINKETFLDIGFIHGPIPHPQKDSSATDGHHNDDYLGTMDFSRAFDGGDMACFAWESGRVTFFPFFHATMQH